MLLAANADNNNVAVIDVSERRPSKPLGFIPTGWYPTSVRFDASGDMIYVANGKGNTPKANSHGPNPLVREPKTIMEYIAGLYQGTLSIIKTPSPKEMARYTGESYACSPLGEPTLQPVAATSEDGGQSDSRGCRQGKPDQVLHLYR